MRRTIAIILTLIATYLALSVAAGIFLAEAALHPGRRPVIHEQEAQGIALEMHAHLEDVAIATADGTPLAAWFAQPQQWNGSAVILLHGVSDNREGVGGFARLFLQHGYSVLLPDARAHGASGGALATYGLREADDVHQWTSWLYHRQSPTCVFGFGESMGAGIIVQAARTEPRLCAIVAESPFGDFREAAFDRIADRLKLTPTLARAAFTPTVDVGLRYAAWKYGVEMTSASPAAALGSAEYQAAPVPVLLIHGLLDVNLRPRESRLIRAAAPDHVTIWYVPGAAHCGASSAQPAEFQRRVLGFYEKALKPIRRG
ncbi:MAG: alpha/beta fold hydrolase [Candidatus Koribacter versatilis]|uniref:Alpha/beta fold hydrolase n=1 Tax=Candidatus Korobacter versatilis TaxID=658062 RepID=A0A932A9E6_9BACT|nr:alpha/beta fold hydrolase [Candidatus Koribacter versatilis]